MILGDTSVLSLVFRRQRVIRATREWVELARLVLLGDIGIIGAVRQELLTGLRDDLQFHRLKRELAEFPDHFICSQDFEAAAQVANTCTRSGIQGSPVDFLICAVAAANELAVFTADRDFQRFARVVPVRIHTF